MTIFPSAVSTTGNTVQDLLADLKACRILARGKKLHSETVECKANSNIYVASALINMYARCGSMVDACRVFDSMEHPDVVTWSALIQGYADNGQGLTALKLFAKMKSAPSSVTFMAALKASTSMLLKGGSGSHRGKEIHNLVVENGFSLDIYVQNTLVDMYAKCGSMLDARLVFDSIKEPSVVSWNALILGYAENGQGLQALAMFRKMNTGGLAPDTVTFMSALKACTSLAGSENTAGFVECRQRGKALLNLVVENGSYTDMYVKNTLIVMYAKCGCMVDARQLFDTMQHPSVVSWTTLILGYAENGQGFAALKLFTRMRTGGPPPDAVTFVAILIACSSISSKEGASSWAECRHRGKELHDLAVKSGYASNIFVQNTLIDMYAKCGSMGDARRVFDSIKNPHVVSWTALILGYAENGQGATGLDLFTKMKSKGPSPNGVTLVAALKACISLALNEGGREECREQGKKIHCWAVKNGSDNNIYVQSSLIDMYAKAGSMADARQVFNTMSHPNVVSWNAMIMGYADDGKGVIALELFRSMKSEGPKPDSMTFMAVLKACSLVGALEFGRKVHSEIDNIDTFLVNRLVDFYAKCGSPMEAQSVFDLHPEKRDIITWTALIAGFSSCGEMDSVFRLFQGMLEADFQPNSISFLSILTCCSHAGLVEKGKDYFDTMSSKHGIIPMVEHYSCMLDGFGRANKLDDAMALLQSMTCSPNDVTWMIILGACRKWKNVGIGCLAFQSVVKLNDSDSSGYMLMGQIYASRGMLKDQKTVMGMSKKISCLRMTAETCWTNETGKVHMFVIDKFQ